MLLKFLQLVAKFMKDNQIVKIIKHIVPVIPFAKAVDMLTTAATSNNGMSWKGRNKCPQGEESEPCIFTMVRVQMSDSTLVFSYTRKRINKNIRG